jgi:hypothetical protein
MSRLIAFTGPAGSGKSTAASALVEEGWVRVKFADQLKNMAGLGTEATSKLSGLAGAVGSVGAMGIAAGAVAGLGAAARARAEIEMQAGDDVPRNGALAKSLTPLIGLTSAQIDDLFIAADKL